MPKLGTSRLTPPSVPRIVERPRLLSQLKENERCRLTLILGQAAQGKSTLAASFAKTSGLNTAWINLGAEDENPVNLFYATTLALTQYLRISDEDSLLHYPASQLGPRDQKALFRDWTLTLFSRIDSSIRIIFDGLDSLSDGSESFLLLNVMLHEAPENIGFMLLSRKEPPFPVKDWKIKQLAFVLNNEDLAFTYAETRSFLRDHCGLSCSSETIRRVWRATEGWTGGLVLLSQVLRSLNDAASELNMLEGLPERFQAEVFLYFGQEIFARISPPQARVLMHSSIFDEIDPRLLDDLLEGDNTEDILRELSRKNLFVNQVYDSNRGWIYRFHQLFRDFLQKMWKQRVKEEERKHFLLKTARACAKRKDLESSLDFFLQAEKYSRAASALRVLGRELIQTGRLSDLDEFLQRFPKHVIQAKPWLLLYRASCRRHSHAAENIPELQKAEAIFRTNNDERGLLQTLAHLLEAIMFLGHDPVPLRVLLAKGEELLSRLDPSKFPREQALLWLQMGFCCSLRGEDIRQGFRASQNAFFLARKIKDRPLQIQALIYSIIPLTFLGEIAEANEIRARIERMLQKNKYPELESLFLKVWSELVLFGGQQDLALAKRLIERLNESIERLGLLYIKAPALYSELAYHIYAGNTEEAAQVGQKLQDLSDTTKNTYGRGMCFVLRGLDAYRQKQWSNALKLLEDGVAIFERPNMRSPLHAYEFSICMALVSMHLGNWQSAESLLLKSLTYFEKTSNHLARTEALLSLALLNDRMGRRVQALEHLEAGALIAAGRQFSHFVIISPSDLLDICLLALEEGTDETAAYASRLLHFSLSDTVASEECRLEHHPNPKVRQASCEIVRSRHRGQRPRVSIETLGGFRVKLDGKLLPDNAWSGNQAQRLLKALAALASERPVRKEMLIEELWPDSDPEAGEKTFKVALHRLRRSLEPDMSKKFGSSYIHLKNGLLYLDSELCETDVQRFIRLSNETMSSLQTGSMNKAQESLHQTDSLYQGDFLPDDPDSDWAKQIRERLRRRHITVHFQAARAYEASGSWTKAIRHYQRALDCDPLLEEAYRRIMALYAERGKLSKARQVYMECRKNLRTFLDAEPDDLTTSMYRKIQS